MARGKKRRKRKVQRPEKVTREQFNTAFGVLKGVKEEIAEDSAIKKQEKRPQKEPEKEDHTFFLNAMSDVTPLSKGARIVAAEPEKQKRAPHTLKDDDLEVMTHLSDLITGSAEMDITFSDEYIEGAVQGFSPKLMQRLKRGRFPIQDYVDLHGLTRNDAQMRIRAFLLDSHAKGLRCVLVVHGRGLNSENNIPVLKEMTPLWLRKGPVRKIVLAFCTARPYDGGTGAIYILLRKRRAL